MFNSTNRRILIFIASLIIPFFAQANAENELLGHQYEVHTVSYSNDGKLLASGSGDTTAIVWNTATKTPKFTITEHKSAIYAVAFSKLQKNILATGSSDGHLVLWDVETQKIIKTLVNGDSTSNGILAMDFSPVSNILAVSYMGGEIALYDTKTLSYHKHTKAHPYGFAMSVNFSPNGKKLVTTGGIDNSLRLFKTDDLSLLYTFGDQNVKTVQRNGEDTYRGTIWDAAFSPDGKTITSVSSAGLLSFWQVGSTSPVNETIVSDYLALSVEYSQDGNKIYVGIDAFNSEVGNYVKIINAKTGRVENQFDAHKNRIRGMALSPDGKSLATASWDETVKIWNL